MVLPLCSLAWLLWLSRRFNHTQHTHTRRYRFPFLGYIRLYWLVFWRELSHVTQRRGSWVAATSRGCIMDVIIGTVLSVLFLQMQLLAVPLLLMFGSSNSVEVEQVLVTGITKAEAQRDGGGEDDLALWHTVDGRIVSAHRVPLPAMGDDDGDAEQQGSCDADDLIADVDDEGATTRAHAKSHTPVALRSGEERCAWLLEVPRHVPFTAVIRRMARFQCHDDATEANDAAVAVALRSLRIVSISGVHGDVQVRVRTDTHAQAARVGRLRGVRVLFDYELPTDARQADAAEASRVAGAGEQRVVYTACAVAVPQLLQVLAAMHEAEGVRVEQVYDFF